MSSNIEAIVIGGSAGALDALGAILSALEPSLRIPVAAVVHLAPFRPSHLVEVLQMKASIRVKEAEDKEPLAPATLYVAPPNYHVLVEANRTFSLSVDEPVHFSRPAIDVLFESAAEAYGPALAGLLLSGASADGARGLACIKLAGGTALVQSPDTAPFRTMPEAGLRLAAVDHVLPLPEIGPFLARLGAPRGVSVGPS